MKMIDKFFDYMKLVDSYNKNGRFNIMTRWKILHRKSDIYRCIKKKNELNCNDIFNYLFIIDTAKEKLDHCHDGKIGNNFSYYVNDNYFKLRSTFDNYSFSISSDKGFSGSDNLSIEIVEGENRRIFEKKSIGGAYDIDNSSIIISNNIRITFAYYILDLMDKMYKKRG